MLELSKISKKTKVICTLILFLLFSGRNVQSASIVVDPNEGGEVVNNKLFGNNLLGHNPATYRQNTKNYYGNTDFGAGVWDSKWGSSIKDAVFLARESGITILRFPGGTGADYYNWKYSIGLSRKEYLFGLNEFFQVCDDIGADKVFTVNYISYDENDAADLVEYLNSPGDSKDNNGINWGKERIKNGHAKPYNVTYFEIGNEVWQGDLRKTIKKRVSPEEYAIKYIRYFNAIKKVSPTAKIGVVLYDNIWNTKVIEIIKDKCDFGIVHTYPSPAWGEKLKEFTASEIFSISWAIPIVKDDYDFKEIGSLFKKYAGKDIPIAVTEYNGGFVQQEPIPYRHCMGTALINAELFKVFMKPENNILMANYWQFCNSYWGMIANGFDGTQKTLNNPYYKRPNYYVFEMYHKYFGNILIDADVECDTYDVSQHRTFKQRIKDFIKNGITTSGNLLQAKWNIRDFKGATVVDSKNVLEIAFSRSKEFNYYHSTKRAKVDPGAYYKLSGYIKTENLNDPEGVCLEVQDSRGWKLTKSADSTGKITGTTDWTYVEVIYRTLDDATGVTAIARRVGDNGPLDGTVYFKDVKLEKFTPELDTKIPYLSVNASKSTDGSRVYLMVINKNMDASETATIDIKGYGPASEGNAWVLNGPSVDATNEVKHDNVKITHKTFDVKGNQFEFTFEPHSLTAIEITARNDKTGQ